MSFEKQFGIQRMLVPQEQDCPSSLFFLPMQGSPPDVVFTRAEATHASKQASKSSPPSYMYSCASRQLLKLLPKTTAPSSLANLHSPPFLFLPTGWDRKEGGATAAASLLNQPSLINWRSLQLYYEYTAYSSRKVLCTMLLRKDWAKLMNMQILRKATELRSLREEKMGGMEPLSMQKRPVESFSFRAGWKDNPFTVDTSRMEVVPARTTLHHNIMGTRSAPTIVRGNEN